MKRKYQIECFGKGKLVVAVVVVAAADATVAVVVVFAVVRLQKVPATC